MNLKIILPTTDLKIILSTTANFRKLNLPDVIGNFFEKESCLTFINLGLIRALFGADTWWITISRCLSFSEFNDIQFYCVFLENFLLLKWKTHC